MLRRISTLFILSLVFIQLNVLLAQNKSNDEVVIAFLTDIHVQPERNAIEGFKKAIQKVNEINPDYVITGGDLIFDALAVNFERADSLFNIYNELVKLIKAPVYNTMGNHEIFGWYEKSGVPKDHKYFGKKLFEAKIGKTYYAADLKHVKLFVLDSIEELPEKGRYYGYVNEDQLNWLKNELSKTDTSAFLIVVSHIPLLTSFSQIRNGSMAANDRGLVVENSKEVLDLFKRHNLRLVLQGHLHFYEDINIQNRIRFITGGAVSARWWTGPNEGLEEGFVLLRIKGNQISAEYIDYGWEVTK
ncbi:MAG: metallophosphoesterase [Ignavibacteria bacterium]|jgi:3',5'-cyclic AMP phosphodiesterase CpdA|nr:metallophosphoesterase [Ignavibacteria bacterium]MDH7526981.1 metallophosphoesterase [Ignavibacteria bacterium]